MHAILEQPGTTSLADGRTVPFRSDGRLDAAQWRNPEGSSTSKKRRTRVKEPKKQKKGSKETGEAAASDTDDSKLKVFYSSGTYLRESALTYLINRTEHVLAIVEAHLQEDKAHKAMQDMNLGGWAPMRC